MYVTDEDLNTLQKMTDDFISSSIPFRLKDKDKTVHEAYGDNKEIIWILYETKRGSKGYMVVPYDLAAFDKPKIKSLNSKVLGNIKIESTVVEHHKNKDYVSKFYEVFYQKLSERRK